MLILHERVRFYRALDQAGQHRFLEDVGNFLGTIDIVGVSVEVTLEDRLLIASSAVIPLFGFPRWHYHYLDEVILYPSSFDREFNFHNPKEFINGMVGNGAMEGKMILSKRALHHGFDNNRDKINVGIHEFIHLYDKENGHVDGVPPVFQGETFVLPWLTLINTKIQEIEDDESEIRDYGATHAREFFAVAGEYFFERPHLLKKNHPELYRMMSAAFQQSPHELLDKKEKKIGEIGRNSLCPCGSNEKYKKCCLM